MQKHQLPPILYRGPEAYPLFNRISIETTSYCNRVCAFCPIANGKRDFFRSMDNDLYASIIKQLYEAGWVGVIQLFLLNEPFLDKQLLKRARLARTALPKSSIYISTNGDAIDFRGSKTVEYSLGRLRDAYEAGITTININVYDPGPDQALRYHSIVQAAVNSGLARWTKHKYQPNNPRHSWISLTDMRPERLGSMLTDQFYARSEEDRAKVVAPQQYCARTQRHLVVLWDGTVPICCATDPTSDLTPVVGDLNKQTVREVWNSEMFFKYRYYTQQAMRVLPACDTCNHKMAYAYLVRQVDADELTKARWERGLEAYQGANDLNRSLVQLQGASA